ncbi:MAG: hypothetical protein LH702_03745 [Phormidesmis sp. CAN_BIN44]|nr:hypothetical protein [Phormidesmis sp. CAN_BIN44]
MSFLRRTLLASLLMGLFWLPGLPTRPALAMPDVVASEKIVERIADPTSTGSDHISALIACLPTELSQPNLKRAWDELGDDQLQRMFNLKPNPKLSQAEIELQNCMNRQAS